MTRPDLGTAEGRGAYVAELRRVAIGWRVAGLAIVAIGAGGLIATRLSGQPVWHSVSGMVSVVTLAIGWTVVAIAVAKRILYHRGRMAE